MKTKTASKLWNSFFGGAIVTLSISVAVVFLLYSVIVTSFISKMAQPVMETVLYCAR